MAAAPRRNTGSDSDGFDFDQRLTTLFTASDATKDRKMDPFWYIDTGASYHVTPYIEDFHDIDMTHKSELMTAKHGEPIQVEGVGTVRVILTNDQGHKFGATISNVRYIPDGSVRLLSTFEATSHDSGFEFHQTFDGTCVMKTRDGHHITIKGRDRKYPLHIQIASEPKNDDTRPGHVMATQSHSMTEMNLWHSRLGHISKATVAKMAAGVIATGITVKDRGNHDYCEACALGKSRKQAQPTEPLARATTPGEIVYTDVFGPVRQPSINGHLYAIIFVDDFTRYRVIYFMKKKSEVPAMIKRFRDEHLKPRNTKLRRLHSDGAKEYFESQTTKKYCLQKGIQQTFTAPYTPAQNGTAERTWGTLVTLARTMMIDRAIDKELWTYILNAACYIINRVPTKANNGKSPIELWTGKVPDLSHLKVIGCPAYKHIETNVGKLDPRATKCIMVGYDTNSPAYLIWNPDTGRVSRSRNVQFNEHSGRCGDAYTDDPLEFADQPDVTPQGEDATDSSNTQDGAIDSSTDSSPSHESTDSESSTSSDSSSQESDNDGSADDSNPPSETDNDSNNNFDPDAGSESSHSAEERPTPPPQASIKDTVGWKSTRQKKPTIRFEGSGQLQATMDNPTEDEPLTYKQATRSPQADQWKAAMETEYNALIKMGTWELVPEPKGRKIIKSKWVYKVKYGPDGEIIKHKARFVAKGFSQIPGVDFGETYAPVARIATLRTLLAIANKHKWYIRQSDISNAYLNADIREHDLYIEQPEGMEKFGPNGEKLVCKLRKGLYGLKQAGMLWHNRLHKFLISIGFKQSRNDLCLYYRGEGKNKLVLIIYVDDLVYASQTEQEPIKFEHQLDKEFKTTHEGTIKWILGIKVDHDIRTGITTLSQEKYVDNILKRFNMESCRGAATPAETTVLNKRMGPLDEDERSSMRSKPYREVLGSIGYAANCTRPDIQFAFGMAARFAADPGEKHWSGILRTLRYLHDTKELKLTFRQTDSSAPIQLTVLVDADYGEDKDTRKSTTGFIIFLDNNPITWSSRAQRIVAQSTLEAEFIALNTAAKEAMYTLSLLTEIGMNVTQPVTVYQDNQSSIHYASNDTNTTRAKHIDIRYHYVKDLVRDGQIILKHVRSAENTADILTKPLDRVKFTHHRAPLLGLEQTSPTKRRESTPKRRNGHREHSASIWMIHRSNNRSNLEGQMGTPNSGATPLKQQKCSSAPHNNTTTQQDTTTNMSTPQGAIGKRRSRNRARNASGPATRSKPYWYTTTSDFVDAPPTANQHSRVTPPPSSSTDESGHREREDLRLTIERNRISPPVTQSDPDWDNADAPWEDPQPLVTGHMTLRITQGMKVDPHPFIDESIPEHCTYDSIAREFTAVSPESMVRVLFYVPPGTIVNMSTHDISELP